MSQISKLSVFDGADIPRLHVLIPVSVTRLGEKITAEWREMDPLVPAYAQVSLTISLEILKSGVYRCSSRTVVPVMESVSGPNAGGYTAAPKVAYENTMDVSGYFNKRSDITGRRVVRGLAENVLAGYSDSRPLITDGPVPELFDLLVAPT